MISILAALIIVSATAAFANDVTDMAQKLDPELLVLAESPPSATEAAEPIQVLIGLDHALNDADEAALTAAGLTIRSKVGDVLTGTIAVRDLQALAEVDGVLRVESSRPMAPEVPPTE
ncbi:MAG: hypothetical protein QNJ16_08170 [Rhodobacter sp.]|nr:hypothetical protein [Rhodobacter sp.]